ncbi:hypothetical protein Tco_1436499 [Tanacetum coccineum]
MVSSGEDGNLAEPTSNQALGRRRYATHSSEVGFINHMLILKLSKSIFNIKTVDSKLPTIKEPQTQDDRERQIKMIQVKEMMQDKDLKNSKSKDKGSRSSSRSMN